MSKNQKRDPGAVDLNDMEIARQAAARANLLAAQSSMAEVSGDGTLAASPTYTPMAVVSNFTPRVTGNVRVIANGICNNTGGAAHTMTLGIKAVPHGAGAPTTTDYSGGAVTAPAGDAVGSTVIMQYRGLLGVFPAALTVGTAYDIYLMGTADAAGSMNFVQHDGQISVQEIG